MRRCLCLYDIVFTFCLFGMSKIDGLLRQTSSFSFTVHVKSFILMIDESQPLTLELDSTWLVNTYTATHEPFHRAGTLTQ